MELWHSQVWKPWAKRLIILGVLGFSGVLAIIRSEDLLTQILVLVIGAIGAVALLQYPALGLFGILVSGAFLSISGPGGINMAILLVAGIAVLWVIDMVVRQRKITIAENRVNLPIVLFIITSFISFGMGQFHWYSLARQAPIDAQIGGLLIFILSVVAFLIVGNLVHSLGWLEALTWLFIAIGAVYTISRMVPRFPYAIRQHYQNGMTTGGIFWVWLLVIPFSQALLNRRLHKFWRASLLVMCAGVLYVAIVRAYDWKSGFVPPLAGVAFIVAILLGRRVLWFVPPALVAAIYLAVDAVANDQYSWITRLEAWRIVVELSLINPIFGVGFANYYWYTRLSPILGWHVSFNSHGQFIDIFSQTGLAGLICFFWILWEIGKLGWQLKDRAPEGFAKAYVYGALGGLAGTLVAGGLADWILPFVYNLGMNGFRSSMLSWLFLGGLVAINQMVKQESSSKTVVPSIGRRE